MQLLVIKIDTSWFRKKSYSVQFRLPVFQLLEKLHKDEKSSTFALGLACAHIFKGYKPSTPDTKYLTFLLS